MSTSGARRTADIVAIVLMAGSLLAVLLLHLLPALLSGLVVFSAWSAALDNPASRPSTGRHRLTALAVSVGSIVGVVFLGVEAGELLSERSASAGVPALLQTLAGSVDQLRAGLPPWLANKLPQSSAALHDTAVDWLRSHATQLQAWGRGTFRVAAYLLVGGILGALIAGARPTGPGGTAFVFAWRTRAAALASSFKEIMAAQLKIAAANTLITAFYLLVVLPAVGWKVPMSSTLVAVTFAAGLVPIVGNLASNAAVVLASLTVSPWAAVSSLVFLVALHKLEYLMNARILGTRLRLRMHELLIAMLVMEALFGIAGLVAAPVYYAWLSREMKRLELI